MKSSNRGFSYHALLYNNQRIDVEKPIGTSVPNNSSVVLQVIGKGGGRQPKKQQSSDEIPGEQIISNKNNSLTIMPMQVLISCID